MDTSSVIDALGGTAVVARMFGVSMPAVSQWRSAGFPARLHLRIYRECQARGIDYDPERDGAPTPTDAPQQAAE